MNFAPLGKAVFWAVFILEFAACRENPEIRDQPPESCDLLSADEIAAVKAQVEQVTEASESLAAWRAWWSVNGTIPFSYAATQSAQYEWDGAAWEVTNATDGDYIRLSFLFPDGSWVFRHSDEEFETITTLSLAEKRVAGVELTYGGANIDFMHTNFYFEDWHEGTSEENGETTSQTLRAPFGTRWLIRATVDAAEQGEMVLKLPVMELTYAFESDGATGQHEVVLNGDVRRYKGPSAECYGFTEKAGALFPSVYELFDASRLAGGNP